jgi:hypothetical protein
MALDAKIADFEDAIQFFSAVEGKAAYIATRNPQDFPQDLLPVITPEALLAMGIGHGQARARANRTQRRDEA